MRFVSLVVIGLLSGISVSSAQSWGVEFAGGYGMGDLREIVYVDSTSWDKLSELIWPLPPSLRGSVEGTIRGENLFARVRFGSSAPLVSGIMIDRDWNIVESKTGFLYNLESRSPSYTLIQANLRAEAGWQFSAFEGPTTRLFAGTRAEQFYAESWSAQNGSTATATPIDGGTPLTQTLNGLLITYRTLSVVPYVGWQVQWDRATFSPELSLRVSPWPMVFGQDFHVLRSLVFFDNAMGGIEIQPSIALSFPVSPTMDWGLRGSLFWAFDIRGDDMLVRAWTSKESTPSSNTAGSAWLDWQLELFVRN